MNSRLTRFLIYWMYNSIKMHFYFF